VARLRRSDLAAPGFRRRGRGRGFEYLDREGRRIQNPAVLERVRALAIPPAWSDVWICPDEHGHVQAVGVDAAGRRQYGYHERWRERADRQKFETMLDFARALPRLRRVSERDLQLEEPSREKVLAAAVRLLDRGFFRTGSAEYADDDGGYGLATLECEHVTLAGGGELVFDYPAKGGVQRIQSVVDAEVYELVRRLKRRRGGGSELLAYKNGRWRDVRADDINGYIREATGCDFTGKDFRTWHATVLAAVALAVAEPAARSRTARQRAMTHAAREVAHYLGNTPAVARSSYIDPRVFDRFQSGETIRDAVVGMTLEDMEGLPTHGRIERAVLKLLEEG
jgi:DNA topoisomerase-1